MNNNLLKPRYIVITDYPQPPFNIDDDTHKLIEGDILSLSIMNGKEVFRRTGRLGHMSVGVPFVPNPEKYPKIFRLLAWYEHRKESEMSGYFIGKWKGADHYVKIDNWQRENETYYAQIGDITFVGDYCTPISETDYIAHKNTI